jgi:hypothetical protein
MSANPNRSAIHLPGVDVVAILSTATRVVLAALVLVVGLAVVLLVAARADLSSGRSPSPGVVVTPHPRSAGY